jgi:aconitate hydratase
VTVHQPSGEQMFIYDAAQKYKEEGVPLVVLGGEEYGTGSSRDWAAKGTLLLGVKAVITSSYERIHRSNLLGMGVLPLQFKEGDSVESLGIDGTEEFSISGLQEGLTPRGEVTLTVKKSNGETQDVPVTVRIDTDVELDYYQHGGILPYVLRQLIEKA